MTQFLKRKVRLWYTFLHGTLSLKLSGLCTLNQILGSFLINLSNKTVFNLSLAHY